MEELRIPQVQVAQYAGIYYVLNGEQIVDTAQIIEHGQIFNNSTIISSPHVIDSAQIIGSAQVIDSAQIIDSDTIFNGAQVIDGSQIIDSAQIIDFPEEGQIFNETYILQGDQIYDPAQSILYGTNAIGASGLINTESASMGPSSNQLTTLNSVAYMPGSDLNNNSSANTKNEIYNTDHDYSQMSVISDDGGYDMRQSGLPDDVPQEIADVENFVCQNMPDMKNLDLNNIDLDAMDIEDEGNFPGLDFGLDNSSQNYTLDTINSTVNSNTVQQNIHPTAVQQNANTASGTVPRITIRTKKIKSPRKPVLSEEQAPVIISTSSYPPLDMLGIGASNTNQDFNDNFETPNHRISSPIYQEDSLSSSSFYSSPASPSTSISSNESPLSPSSEKTPRRPRLSLATMDDAQRYRHIRVQNNESSRAYRERKKMGMKEAEAELQVLQERNTRLKEVFEALKQKKDISHELMKGFVKNCSKRRNM
ncbi:unnamed protein product [Meganyctiphanes norvegica]|uniref:BZIP domain-containing protein n=1 Tax=Meganyctiphanes norvegica TaxID=48144 RepID=A0AAV2RL05_MEGNR